MFDDTPLMHLVIEDLAVKNNWTYEETLDKFYHSKTCECISDRETGLFTFSHLEIIERFEEETAMLAAI